MFTLSQTLAGTWVITLPNPEEAGWETQLVDFNYEAVSGGKAEEAMDKAVIASFTAFIKAMPHLGWRVTSHKPAAAARFKGMVEAALAA